MLVATPVPQVEHDRPQAATPMPVVHDQAIERLLRQSEEERRKQTAPAPAPRSQSEPYEFD